MAQSHFQHLNVNFDWGCRWLKLWTQKLVFWKLCPCQSNQTDRCKESTAICPLQVDIWRIYDFWLNLKHISKDLTIAKWLKPFNYFVWGRVYRTLPGVAIILIIFDWIWGTHFQRSGKAHSRSRLMVRTLIEFGLWNFNCSPQANIFGIYDFERIWLHFFKPKIP